MSYQKFANIFYQSWSVTIYNTQQNSTVTTAIYRPFYVAEDQSMVTVISRYRVGHWREFRALTSAPAAGGEQPLVSSRVLSRPRVNHRSNRRLTAPGTHSM